MSSHRLTASIDPPRRTLFFAGGILILCTLAIYHNAFRGPFLFDDNEAIPDNPTIRHLWPLSTVFSPPPDTTVNHRPLLNLTFALNYAVSGMATWSYHAVNVLIHVLAGLALFGLVRRTLLRPVLRERFGPVALPAAFASALLWLVHPAQTQCVAYIVQRAESLMGLFYLLTLYGFVRGAEAEGGARRLWFAASAGACLLGMWTKESAVTAPLMVLFYDRTFVSGTFRESWRRHRAPYCGLAATWLVFVPIVVAGGRRDATSGFGMGIPFWGYLGTQFHAVAHYLKIAFWPHPLLLIYGPGGGIDYTRLEGPGAIAPYALLVALLLAGTVWALWRRPLAGFAGAWFLGILAPTSLVPGSGDAMADRRLYLPLAAIIVPLVAGGFARMGRRCLPAVLALAVALGIASERRNQVYGSEAALWRDQVAGRPDNIFAHNNLGNALEAEGRLNDAIAQYEEELRLNPDYAIAHSNLGNALNAEGRTIEAIAQFEEALRLKPDFAGAHFNLGSALQKLPGRLNDAIAQFEEALRLKPDFAEAHNLLGYTLEKVPGRLNDAIAQLEEALRLKPNDAEAHNNLGIALGVDGRLNDAVAQFEEALRLKPDFAEAHNNLGYTLEKVPGRLNDAVAQFEEALRLKPNYAAAHFDLAIALLKKPGNGDEAKAHLEVVLRLQPENGVARQLLAEIKASQP